MNPIIVINPNSTQAVTDGMDRAVDPLRMEGGPPIECVTLEEGPSGDRDRGTGGRRCGTDL